MFISSLAKRVWHSCKAQPLRYVLGFKNCLPFVFFIITVSLIRSPKQVHLYYCKKINLLCCLEQSWPNKNRECKNVCWLCVLYEFLKLSKPSSIAAKVLKMKFDRYFSWLKAGLCTDLGTTASPTATPPWATSTGRREPATATGSTRVSSIDKLPSHIFLKAYLQIAGSYYDHGVKCARVLAGRLCRHTSDKPKATRLKF